MCQNHRFGSSAPLLYLQYLLAGNKEQIDHRYVRSELCKEILIGRQTVFGDTDQNTFVLGQRISQTVPVSLRQILAQTELHRTGILRQFLEERLDFLRFSHIEHGNFTDGRVQRKYLVPVIQHSDGRQVQPAHQITRFRSIDAGPQT